jgi:hypothetical protein
MQPAVILESHPVHHSLFGLLFGGEFVAMHHGFSSRPQKLSVGALPQQLPFLLIDERMLQSFNASWNSPLHYWLPRSLWNSTPGSGQRRHHAMASASLTRLVCMCGYRLQPTTWRLNRSMTAAR